MGKFLATDCYVTINENYSFKIHGVDTSTSCAMMSNITLSKIVEASSGLVSSKVKFKFLNSL